MQTWCETKWWATNGGQPMVRHSGTRRTAPWSTRAGSMGVDGEGGKKEEGK
ncbi:hypothetical protein FACS189472_14620 [Alphaproteobacteria bacterium]|nr:hypothetical protein FACS189472_14620 [Alphaproteobacteria bacterium]